MLQDMKLILFDNQSWQHRNGKIRFADSKITKVEKKKKKKQKSPLCRFLICWFKRRDPPEKMVLSYMFVQEHGNKNTSAGYR